MIRAPIEKDLVLVGGDEVTAVAHTGDGWEVSAGQDEIDGCYWIDWVPADCVADVLVTVA